MRSKRYWELFNSEWFHEDYHRNSEWSYNGPEFVQQSTHFSDCLPCLAKSSGTLLFVHHWWALPAKAMWWTRLYSGFGPLFLNPAADYDQQEPWSRMTARKYRLFHADVTINAPKERTLFNYNIKVSNEFSWNADFLKSLYRILKRYLGRLAKASWVLGTSTKWWWSISSREQRSISSELCLKLVGRNRVRDQSKCRNRWVYEEKRLWSQEARGKARS